MNEDEQEHKISLLFSLNHDCPQLSIESQSQHVMSYKQDAVFIGSLLSLNCVLSECSISDFWVLSECSLTAD